MSKKHEKNKDLSDDEAFESSDSEESENEDSDEERVKQKGGANKDDDHDGDDPESDSDNPGDDNPDELGKDEEADTTDSETGSEDESESEEGSDEEIIKDEDAESDQSDQEDEDNEVIETGDDEVSTSESKGSVYRNLNKGKELVIMDDNAEKEYAMLPLREVPKADRITKPFMTRFELARFIGLRAQQIAQGAPALIEGVSNYLPQVQSNIELVHKQTPLKVRRYLPMGWYEDWDLDELEQITILDDDFFLPPTETIEL